MLGEIYDFFGAFPRPVDLTTVEMDKSRLDESFRPTERMFHALRERHRLSQAVLASVLNTSLSTVRQWEIGEKHPSGPSLKLLSLLDRKGLGALI